MALQQRKGYEFPPRLSIELPTVRDLPKTPLKPWSDVQLPVDILLLTVQDCEFLACFAFLKNSFQSYHSTLGNVFFGTMGESGEEALKVALMKCSMGSSGPGGSRIPIKNAVVGLRPKASFSVGYCFGLNPDSTKLGDVVVSSKLSTEQLTTPVGRKMRNLIKTFSSESWNPPLKGEETVQVHRDRGIFSGTVGQFNSTGQRRLSQTGPIALERKGEGLFVAAHLMNFEWVIVKGISHFHYDGNTPDESWKSFASVMAASVVSYMLNVPGFFKEWPHYGDLTAKNRPKTTTKPDKQIPEKLKKKTKDDEGITKDKLDNNEDLNPAFVRARGEKALAAYHRALGTGGSTYDKRVKVLLVGQDRVGKTSLGKALRGEPFNEAELSTDGVQMIPAVKNAGTGAWRNPAFLGHTTVFDHKVAAKTAEDLLSTHVDQLTNTQLTETSVRSESEKFHQKLRVVSKTTVQSSIADDKVKKTMTTRDAEDNTREKLGGNEDDQDFQYQMPEKPIQVPLEEKIPETVAVLLEKYLAKNEIDPNERIWPVIWDFAGQGIYRAVHTIFFSSEDIFLLVVDLSKKLGEKALWRVNADQNEHTVSAREDEETNLDHLVKWMDLIQSLQRADQKESLLHPPVILVGTHADCVDDPSKEMKLVEERYLSLFGESSHLPHIAACLPIDNTKAGKSTDQEEIIELRKTILELGEKMSHTKKEIPLQWHRVENEVSKPIWQRQKYLLKKSFREDIVSRYCTFANEDEFNELLHFLHCRGTVVYHEHEHAGGKAGLIVLDPQWLVNVVFEIINVKGQKHEPWRIKRDRKKLAAEGILSRRLIDHSCEHKSLEPIEHSLISLMDKFNIICKWPEKAEETETEESWFLVPCMLTTYSEEEITDEVDYPAPLYLTFKTKCVPSGLFCRLLVLFGENLRYAKLYANEAKFSLDDENHVLQLMCYRTVVKLHISGENDDTPPQKHYDYVLSHLKTFLEKLKKEYPHLRSMSETLCARSTFYKGKETTPCARHDERSCRHPDCGHYIPLDGRILGFETSDLMKPWIKAGDNLSKEEKGNLKPEERGPSSQLEDNEAEKEDEGHLKLKDERPSPYKSDEEKEEKGNFKPEERGPSSELEDNEAEKEDEGHLKLKDERPSPYEGDEEQDEHEESSENSFLGTESSSESQDGSLSDDSDSLSGSSFTIFLNGPRVAGEPREDSFRTKIYEATVTSEGVHLDIIKGAAYLMFPPNALSQPTSVVIHNWKRSACSPRREENEAIVSNVIEISSSTGQPLEFDVAVKLFLCHSAPALRGYEVVIKKQIGKSNDWEDVKGTKDLRDKPDTEDEYPSNLDFSTFHFPVAQADITEFSTYTVVCRLKSSPSYTITSYGCSIDHPDYPDVKVTIPENAVESETAVSVKLKVQEVQNEESERHDVFIGPILRIICSQKVTFSKPVTIQLPISLRHEQQEIPDISECRVRVLCQKSAGDHGDWREITSDLRNPASFDGKFVRFQVEHFCKFAVTVGRHRSQDSAFDHYKNDSRVRIMAYFFAYLPPNRHNILILMCCPHHLQRSLEEKLEKKEVTFSSVSSRELMKPEDKVYFLVSGGIRPCKEDMHSFLRFVEESESKLQVRCSLVSADHAEIEFLSDPHVKNGTSLGKLYLEKSTPVVNSYTGATGKKKKKKKRKNPNGKRMFEVDASQENHKTRKRKKQKAQEPTEEHPRKRKKTQLDKVQGNAEDVEMPSGKKKKKKKKRKNHNGKSMSEAETPRESKKRKNRTSPEKDEEPPPDKQERKKDKKQKTKEIRDGEVDKNHLEELSKELGKSWEDLASVLKFDQAEIENFDHMNKELPKKSHRMLCAWKRREASSATYTVLYKALCHKYVGRKDLAEKYCIRESTDKEESTLEG